MTQESVFNSSQLTAIEQNLGGDCVVIVFHSTSSKRQQPQYIADQIFLKQNMSAIGILSLEPTWYPPLEMNDLLETVKRRVGDMKVITYGHGEGGYGALKFASRLGASATLAFNPAYSIHPSDVASFDSRFNQNLDKSNGHGIHITQEDLCGHTTIFLNRADKRDVHHARRLTGYAGVRLVITPFSPAETIRVLAQRQPLPQLIGKYASLAPPDETESRHIIRASRNSQKYADQILRQLIRRISRPRDKFLRFATAALQRSNNANPFYAAIIAYAKGDSTLAQTELDRFSKGSGSDTELFPHWHLARRLDFFQGEYAIAKQLLERCPENLQACLRAVSTLVTAGEKDSARNHLMRLSKHRSAMEYITLFTEIAAQIQDPDALEDFLLGELPNPARICILETLVLLYRETRNRKDAFKKWQELELLSRESPSDRRKVASLAMEIGEVSMAGDVLEDLRREAPHDHLLALDAVDKLTESHKARAESELDKITSAPDISAVDLERASHKYERLGKTEAAFAVILRAVALSNSGPAVRHRLAELLGRRGQRRRALAELETILADESSSAPQLRKSGTLARTLKDERLARKFAEAQYGCATADSDSGLYLTRVLRLLGERKKALDLIISIFNAERQRAYLSERQRIRLAQELYEVGEVARAKEVSTETVRNGSKSPEARKLNATIALLDKMRT